MGVSGAWNQVAAGATLHIQGRLDVTHYIQGKLDREASNHIDFAVERSLSGPEWTVSVTNADQPSDWHQFHYDGSNTFFVVPFSDHIKDAPQTAELYGSVSSSPYFNMRTGSILYHWLPWLAYALRPSEVSEDMPVPWWVARRHLSAYGYRWVLPSTNGLFITNFTCIRDTNFDLATFEDELLRPGFFYPASVEAKEYERDMLHSRKSQLHGTLEATFRTERFYATNGLVLPRVAEMRQYFSTDPFETTNVLLGNLYRVEASDITLQDDDPRPLNISAGVYVRDFRLQKQANGKVFNYAQYTGKSWLPADDPSLVRQQERYIRFGPKAGEYGWWANFFNPAKNNRYILVLSLFVILQIAVVTALVVRKRRKKNK
ncbi:MAG: hypothetical protein U1F98_11575 [Verrucomicrobiota bacterium]